VTIRLLTGDCRDVLATLPEASVHCCVTSPPYYGLRDYGTAQWEGGDAACDHVVAINADRTQRDAKNAVRDDAAGAYAHPSGWRAGGRAMDLRQCSCGARRIDRQLGLEATPEAYLAAMVEVFRAVRRVLRDDGTCWVNIGDSYANGGVEKRDGGHGFVDGGKAKLDAAKGALLSNRWHDPVLKPKDLMLMPARLALALQADGWWVRSAIVWAKPNPMPESCRDRPTSAYEMVYLLSKAARYFYDADAVREEVTGNQHVGRADGGISLPRGGGVDTGGARPSMPTGLVSNRNLRNVWTIPTHAYSDAHFATFPPALVERCIRAGTSERGACSACGAPWVRVTERVATGRTQKMADGWDTGDGGHGTVHRAGREAGMAGVPVIASIITGWRASCQCAELRCTSCSVVLDSTYERKASDGVPGERECPHCGSRMEWSAPNPVPCTVLDCFVGSGTTALVADRLQRHAIGIDLSIDYAAMAQRRLTDDCPLFTSWAPAETDAQDERMRDLFSVAAD